MDNSHAPKDPNALPPETFAADRWVPCLVEEDEYCLHFGCQAMEPIDDFQREAELPIVDDQSF